MSDTSFQASTPRRGRVEGCPGLWWRRRADGSSAYEIKLRQNGILGSRTLPEGTSERQARTAWKTASAMRDEGGRPLSLNVTLGAVAAEAFADLEARVVAGTRSQRTLDGYLGDWTRYIEPSLGRKKISKVESKDVLMLIGNLRSLRREGGKEGLAEWTVSGVITSLRMILRFARHSGYTTNDPFSTLSSDDLPQQRVRETFDGRVLRPTEIERLIRAATPTAAMTGHSPAVYSEHYARPFRDAEEREKVRKSLASIGFGNAPVDQPVDQRPI